LKRAVEKQQLEVVEHELRDLKTRMIARTLHQIFTDPGDIRLICYF